MSDTATTIRDLIGLGMAPALASYLVLAPKAETFSVLDASATPATINGLDAAQGGSVSIIGGSSSTAANAGGAVALTGGVAGGTGAGGAVTIRSGAGGATSGNGGAVSISSGIGTAGNGTGGSIVIAPGASNGTGGGAIASVTGGASGAGATGAGGQARLIGGQALSDGGAGGAAVVTGGQGGVTTGGGGAVNITGGVGAPTGSGGAVNLTGGAAGATSGNGGSLIFTGGTPSTGSEGGVMQRLPVMFRQRTPYALTGSALMVASSIVGADMLITGNAATGAGVNYQLPTATNLDTALPSALAADDGILLRVINLSIVAAEDITITTNTGWTLVGSMVIESHDNDRANASATFIVRFTAANTATLYRVS